MPLPTLTRPDRLCSHAAAGAHHRIEPGGPPAAEGTVIPLRSTPNAVTQHILSVEFIAPEGCTWHALGGGETLAAAIAFARESCPAHTAWQPVRWNDLYGD